MEDGSKIQSKQKTTEYGNTMERCAACVQKNNTSLFALPRSEERRPIILAAGHSREIKSRRRI